MKRVYQQLRDNQTPHIEEILMVYTIFASASLAWTEDLLTKLDATETEAKTANEFYANLANSILDNTHVPVSNSATTFVAINYIAYVIMHMQGLRHQVIFLRARCRTMAQQMNIHKLDTPECREEREQRGENFIETEVLRRAWWSMVATDW